MAVEKTKHAFVDDNPYLVYSGEPDSTVDDAGGGSGGGGGNDGYFLITVTDLVDSTSGLTGKADKSKSEVLDAVNNGKIPFLKVEMSADNIRVVYYLHLSSATLDNPTELKFNSIYLVSNEGVTDLNELYGEYYGATEYDILLNNTFVPLSE